METTQWRYPGSRWWKFDFHTHTPASLDTPWHQKNIGLSHQDWLLKYMKAEIDCVAVTDYNSGAWIDPLKENYNRMKLQADQGQPPIGFRELTIFPGVEISVSGGVHLLAIFDPGATTRTITGLLGAVGYRGSEGDCDAVTSRSPNEVMDEILRSGGIPIPAHADAADGLLAHFRSQNVPGSRYTWVKMAHPNIEGLRLALLDGNEVSIRRSDEGDFDPFRVPAHMVTAIEVENARYMGNGQKARLECSPLFNAVIGGRGTGKSTVIHALRLATRREQELTKLGQNNEPNARFAAFGQIPKGRDDKGALRSNTVIRVAWQYEDAHFRLLWRADRQGTVVEEYDKGNWRPSSSQSVNADRFPVRIFSQGQIASLAGGGRQTLLSIVDESAEIEPLRQEFMEARGTFFTLRARLRELDGKLAGQPEVQRKLAEVEKKLATLAQTDHATVLHAYAQAQHQLRDVKMLFDQLRQSEALVENLPEQIVLEEWPYQHFTPQDADLLAWRRDVDQSVEQICIGIREQWQKLNAIIESQHTDPRFQQWRARGHSARQAHDMLQQRLREQGVSDPQAFPRLIQERQQLEMMLKDLQRKQSDRQTLLGQIESQRALMEEKRRAITRSRRSFIESTLTGNPHVRIAVVPFGFEPRHIERELRELIDVPDERFEDDILSTDGSKGLAFDLAIATEEDKIAILDVVKQRLIDEDVTVGARFRNYLTKKLEKPEFADHVLAWFPEDDLRIEYQRGGSWTSISQGSQGQRSAALLAFLLAFGEEPLVLDQPEDDLDNHLIYDLIVRQIRENKLRRQLIVVTHNPNVVINGDAELVHVMDFGGGQCVVQRSGALQDGSVREEVCRVMEGGREAFSKRWKRLGTEGA
ncbi:MAG: AAA family ATPase [Magnetococcales bacterium]|nr:AAA family ATPase [Magnetococcales bacterium]